MCVHWHSWTSEIIMGRENNTLSRWRATCTHDDRQWPEQWTGVGRWGFWPASSSHPCVTLGGCFTLLDFVSSSWRPIVEIDCQLLNKELSISSILYIHKKWDLSDTAPIFHLGTPACKRSFDYRVWLSQLCEGTFRFGAIWLSGNGAKGLVAAWTCSQPIHLGTSQPDAAC